MDYYDLSYVLFICANTLTLVALATILRYAREGNLCLILLLAFTGITQLLWEYLPSYVVDINYILFVVLSVSKTFYFKSQGIKKCNGCNIKDVK